MTCPVMQDLNRYMEQQDKDEALGSYCEENFDDSYEDLLSLETHVDEFNELLAGFDEVASLATSLTFLKMEGQNLSELSAPELLCVFSDMIAFAETFREDEEVGKVVDRISISNIGEDYPEPDFEGDCYP